MATTHLWATLQTTSTTGTGTLTLIAASGSNRSFQTALGSSSVPTFYVIRPATGYEFGVGVYDGGSPGTLTRPSAQVIASSNGDALVSLPAGTADVFVPSVPGQRGWKMGTGSDVLGVRSFGETYVWSGGSIGTMTLPAVASCPPRVMMEIINIGSATLTVEADGSETFDPGGTTTITLTAGTRKVIYRKEVAAGLSTTAWMYF